MRVARASSGPKIPGRKRGRINEMGYQGNSSERNELFHAGRMAKDVDAALHEVIQKAGGKDAAQADEYVRRLKTERRYQRDVY